MPAAVNLLALPVEVQQCIGFYAGLESLDDPRPPSGLTSLAQVNRKAYNTFSVQSNCGLYAQLFTSTFDCDAIERRFGNKILKDIHHVAAELVRRWKVLSYIKAVALAGDFSSSAPSDFTAAQVMWEIYMIVMENDGKNLPILLDFALLPLFLCVFKRKIMLTATLSSAKYPEETPDKTIWLYLNYWLDEAGQSWEQPSETTAMSDIQERMFILRPYAFAAHKYLAFHAPWNIRLLPLEERPPIVELSEDEINPFIADTAPRAHLTKVFRFGKDWEMTPPLVPQAAIQTLILETERWPKLSDLNSISTTAESDDPVRFQGGVTAVGNGEIAPAPVFITKKIGGVIRAEIPILNLGSKIHDKDFERLRRCGDPCASVGLKPLFWAGCLEGRWRGTFSFFDFNAYRDMVGGSLTSLYDGAYGTQHFEIELHETIIRTTKQNLGGIGTLLNAGLSDTGTLLEEFEEMLPDCREEEDEDSENIKEIIISGHGKSAWGDYKLTGRVRPWDGMIMMLKTYHPVAKGRWLYRGYLQNESRYAGMWRDTFTNESLRGYEGTFAMFKQETPVIYGRTAEVDA